jgi:hypothetical protein
MRHTLGVILLFIAGSVQANGAICSDPDFVDECGNGTDVLTNSVVTFSILIVDVHGTPSTFDMVMEGPITVERTGNTGTGHTDAEITDLVLSDGTRIMRAGYDQLGDDGRRTLGAIDQTAPGTADSWFSLLFEVENTPFGTVHNNDPYIVEAEIDQIIPAVGTVYLPSSPLPLPLYGTTSETEPVAYASAVSFVVTHGLIDIKPGSAPNTVNPKSQGKLPVAILGSDSFDVLDVDVMTVVFGPSAAAPAHMGGHLKDVNHDGFDDILFHFKTNETGIASGDEQACLSGELLNSTPFEGCDSINTK